MIAPRVSRRITDNDARMGSSRPARRSGQPRTSKEQLTESGKGSDQDHDPGATVAWESNELE